MAEKRAACLNCIDGRIQLPAIQWITENYAIDCVDMITEPGMDGLLSDVTSSIDWIKRKIDISIEKNNALMIFIVGHHDCRGNPVSEDTHKKQVRLAVSRLKEEFSDLTVIGLWINDEWKGKEL